MTLTLEAGETKSLNFSLTPVIIPLAKFQLSNFIASPWSANLGDTVTIMVTITNIGNTDGEFLLNFRIIDSKGNTVTSDSYTITLAPNQAITHREFITPVYADTYHAFANIEEQTRDLYFAIYAPKPGIIGDLNDDGLISVEDLQILEKCLVGYPISQISPLPEAEFLRRADINGDSLLNAQDLTLLERLLG